MRKVLVTQKFWLELAGVLKPEERHTYRDEGGLVLFTPDGNALWFVTPVKKPETETAA